MNIFKKCLHDVTANEAGATSNEDETSRHWLGCTLNSVLLEGELCFSNVLRFTWRGLRGLFILSDQRDVEYTTTIFDYSE